MFRRERVDGLLADVQDIGKGQGWIVEKKRLDIFVGEQHAVGFEGLRGGEQREIVAVDEAGELVLLSVVRLVAAFHGKGSLLDEEVYVEVLLLAEQISGKLVGIVDTPKEKALLSGVA